MISFFISKNFNPALLIAELIVVLDGNGIFTDSLLTINIVPII